MITGFVIAAVGLSWPAPCAARGCCAPRAVPVRLLCEPAVILKGAEPNFVEPGENLNPDETLVQALKTFDGHNGALLCAGALIWRRTESHGHVHDLWIADSLDRGVGANVQMRGALRILDALFLRHLRSGVAEFNVLAGSGEGCTTAAHAAARSRGFVHELECPETAELLLAVAQTAGQRPASCKSWSDGGARGTAQYATRRHQASAHIPPPDPRRALRVCMLHFWYVAKDRCAVCC